jgi:gas vesicle protein GvpG
MRAPGNPAIGQPGNMAFILDDILLLPLTGPVAGFRWIMKQIQTMADEELMNDQPWKERLIELQMMLELGEISEADYTVEEAQVFQALRDIRARREAIARQMAAERGEVEDEGGIGIFTGYGQ